MVNPRVLHLPGGRRDLELGERAVELAAEAGLELDEWQAFVLRESLAQSSPDRWSAKEVGVNVARQNGKGAVIEARILAELYLVKSPLTIYSAHNFDTSLEHFRRIEFLVEETPRLAREIKGTKGGRKYGVTFGHGKEGIELTGDRRLRFRTRTKGGGRGFSCNCLILDEAMFLPDDTLGALLPTLSAKLNPQVWYLGSAVDQLVHEHGVVFARARERALAGEDQALAYFEWSVEGANPDQLSAATVADVAAWAQANPALGIRIDPEHVSSELRAMDRRTFAVERLGVGDWPATDAAMATMIDVEMWLDLEDAESKLADPVFFGFDVSPERKASIAAAGQNEQGLWHVETVEDRGGTGWLPKRLGELVAEHRPAGVVCDGYGPAASLIPALDELNVEVTTFDAGDHGQACGRLVDVIAQGEIRHVADDPLLQAIKAAKTRPLGDAWAWSRRNSSGNISPLVSATLALSAAMTTRPPKAAFSWV